MDNMMAVAIFSNIEPDNIEKFKTIASEMLNEINKQESILRYELFFSLDNRSCVVLEEYTSPEGVFEHVRRHSAYLDQLTALGGKIAGSVFPMSNDSTALSEIMENWDTKVHSFFTGKPRKKGA